MVSLCINLIHILYIMAQKGEHIMAKSKVFRNIFLGLLLLALVGGFVIACSKKDEGSKGNTVAIIEVSLGSTTLAAGASTELVITYKNKAGDKVDGNDVKKGDISFRTDVANSIETNITDDKKITITPKDNVINNGSGSEASVNIIITTRVKVGASTLEADATLKVVAADDADAFYNQFKIYNDFSKDVFDVNADFNSDFMPDPEVKPNFDDNQTRLVFLTIAFANLARIDSESNSKYHTGYVALKAHLIQLQNDVFSKAFKDFMETDPSESFDFGSVMTQAEDVLKPITDLKNEIMAGELFTLDEILDFQKRFYDIDIQTIIDDFVGFAVNAITDTVNIFVSNNQDTLNKFEKYYFGSVVFKDVIVEMVQQQFAEQQLYSIIDGLLNQVKEMIDNLTPNGAPTIDSVRIELDNSYIDVMGSTTLTIEFFDEHGINISGDYENMNNITFSGNNLSFDNSVYKLQAVVTADNIMLKQGDDTVQNITVSVSVKVGSRTITSEDVTLTVNYAPNAEAFYNQFGIFNDFTVSDFDVDAYFDPDFMLDPDMLPNFDDNQTRLIFLSMASSNYAMIDQFEPNSQYHTGYLSLKAHLIDLYNNVFSKTFRDFVEADPSEWFNAEDLMTQMMEAMGDMMTLQGELLSIVMNGTSVTQSEIDAFQNRLDALDRDQMLNDMMTIAIDPLTEMINNFVQENGDTLTNFEKYYFGAFFTNVVLEQVKQLYGSMIDGLLAIIQEMINQLVPSENLLAA